MSDVNLTDTEREALARLFDPSAFEPLWVDSAKKERAKQEAYRKADFLLTSEWLAARDARVRAAALAPIQANVSHHVSPVIGWLRLHVADGTPPTPTRMRAMVEHLTAALAAAGVGAAPGGPACMCGESESAHDRIDPPHMFVSQDAAPNETTTEDGSFHPPHVEVNADLTEQYRRAGEADRRGAVPSGHEQEGVHRGRD